MTLTTRRCGRLDRATQLVADELSSPGEARGSSSWKRCGSRQLPFRPSEGRLPRVRRSELDHRYLCTHWLTESTGRAAGVRSYRPTVKADLRSTDRLGRSRSCGSHFRRSRSSGGSRRSWSSAGARHASALVPRLGSLTESIFLEMFGDPAAGCRPRSGRQAAWHDRQRKSADRRRQRCRGRHSVISDSVTFVDGAADWITLRRIDRRSPVAAMNAPWRTGYRQ